MNEGASDGRDGSVSVLSGSPGLIALIGLCVAFAGCGSNSSPANGNIAQARHVAITAHRWAFEPAQITLEKGVPVVFDLTSDDVHHGFNVAEWQIRADIVPGMPQAVSATPTELGSYTFFCDFYCGSGHEDMQGQITVE